MGCVHPQHSHVRYNTWCLFVTGTFGQSDPWDVYTPSTYQHSHVPSNTWCLFVTGTFGQSDPWDVYTPSTYQHPHVPYDVLVDPLSMPDHPVIGEKLNTHQVIHEDSARGSKSEVRACTLNI